MHLLHEGPVPFLLALVYSLQLCSVCPVTVAMYVSAYSVKLVFWLHVCPRVWDYILVRGKARAGKEPGALGM